MLNKIKQIIKNKKGFVTIEHLAWAALISLIIGAVAVALKPDIVGSNSILTNSSNRIKGLEDVMTE
ncbi:hypothetical protein RBQ61_02785 [Sedimentibacter sp. MB35-C1]|uniref:hypothetical protein n=1 Tax=Sedimentibacter sp. MB35-C1 TaxID=3070995 RepID=UPI0027E0F702|nr:hypothetical protein [Sedimentibacter sp. MB35-C1]WMJ77871.1 hypothetical protein RBQ61_02785 [Sedimentibacter sp. MB35-C1]